MLIEVRSSLDARQERRASCEWTSREPRKEQPNAAGHTPPERPRDARRPRPRHRRRRQPRADYAAQSHGLRRRGRRSARLRPLRQLRRSGPGSRLRQQPPAVHRPGRRHDSPGAGLAAPLRRALLSRLHRARASLTLMVGVLTLLFAAARLGFLVRAIPTPVTEGFIAAAALLIIGTQVAPALGA